MRKMTKSAFTLVELIVVITILAILATVAFISLGGQTDNARNTVKKDAIGKLASSVEVARTTGLSIAAFATDNNAALTNTTDEISGQLVTDVVTSRYIGAGDINLSALEVKAEDFKDKANSYKYGYSKFRGGKFEVAGSLKEGEFNTTYLVGSYDPRTVAESTVTGDISTTNDKQFILDTDANIKKLSIGDTVTDGTNDIKITGVSSDYKTLTLNTTITIGTAELKLGAPETLGLIESTTATVPVTNASQNVPYLN
ncbi:MAG: type II secretion system protein [Candidatus Gracilibacteria bacterium]|nr:type II secretion system protein [Candidatus Gracilibacteria bacterium]MDQ7022939.1 type II secretion system protein [Candidatus Gracilibacteria bacterium]